VSVFVWGTREAESVGRGRERSGYRVPLTHTRVAHAGRSPQVAHAGRSVLARKAFRPSAPIPAPRGAKLMGNLSIARAA
jgi:hypothetical protein